MSDIPITTNPFNYDPALVDLMAAGQALQLMVSSWCALMHAGSLEGTPKDEHARIVKCFVERVEHEYSPFKKVMLDAKTQVKH